MYYPEFVHENETHKILWDFEMQTDHLISARRPYLVIVNEKENLRNSGLCRSGWSHGKTEGTVTKGLVQGLKDSEIRGPVETIQTTALLKSARILRRVMVTWGDFPSLRVNCQQMLAWKTVKE